MRWDSSCGDVMPLHVPGQPLGTPAIASPAQLLRAYLARRARSYTALVSAAIRWLVKWARYLARPARP